MAGTDREILSYPVSCIQGQETAQEAYGKVEEQGKESPVEAQEEAFVDKGRESGESPAETYGQEQFERVVLKLPFSEKRKEEPEEKTSDEVDPDGAPGEMVTQAGHEVPPCQETQAAAEETAGTDQEKSLEHAWFVFVEQR